MDSAQLQQWIDQNPTLALIGILLLSLIGFLLARAVIARGLMGIAKRTKTIYDDIIVHHLRPFRVAWLAPLAVIYAFAPTLPFSQEIVETVTLFLILWVSTFTLNALLSAVNEIYEASPNYRGISIQGFLDIVKILVILLAGILSVSIFTGKSPLVLITGVGALTAVLLLIFRDTILSIVASVQISAHDLIKEGDWIEVPSYEADGEVLNMSLHTIKIQNWDKTITVIPTYRIVEVAYKNWRGMQESGGRRIKRSIAIDMGSIKFCDPEMLAEVRKIDLIQEYLVVRLQAMDNYRREKAAQIDSPLDGPQITNVEILRAYMAAYLRNRADIHQADETQMPFLIRSLDPNRAGLPIEVYVFAKTTDWVAYEQIQAEIFDHFLAAAAYFGLRVFQEPTGMDFAAFAAAR